MYLPVILTIAAVSFNSVYRLSIMNIGGNPVIFVMIMFQLKVPPPMWANNVLPFLPKTAQKDKKKKYQTSPNRAVQYNSQY